MKVLLSEIKGSTPRVRQTQSAEKLDELAESIREEGVIVPIKLRKNGTGYTLVYGHRRVAAAKMAGLKEIEAFVADVPDDKLLKQALVENVVREDMPGAEIGEALINIKKATGETNEVVARAYGHNESWVRENIELYEASKRLGKIALKSDLSTLHLRQANAGTDNQSDADKVLKYAAEKELSARDTRQVAEVVRKASAFGGSKAVARVLARPYREIEATAASLPVRRPKAIAHKIEGRIAFQWVKDPRVILAEEGLKAVSAVVSAINRSEDDKGGGKVVLKNLRRQTAAVLKQLNEVLR